MRLDVAKETCVLEVAHALPHPVLAVRANQRRLPLPCRLFCACEVDIALSHRNDESVVDLRLEFEWERPELLARKDAFRA